MQIDLIFAEFGRVNVDTDHFRQYFPEARLILYTDVPGLFPKYKEFDDVVTVYEPFDRSHPRYGWRMCDYWQVRGMLDSKADVAIAFDADVRIVSDSVRAIIPLAQKFGLCLPANPRKLVKIDTEIGTDSDRILDESLGMGYAMNLAIMAYCQERDESTCMMNAYLDEMDKNPVRGPLAWWRAMWKTGWMPLLLPPQWCVCKEDIGIGNEIMLHIGHPEVAKHYGA
jgi:hypothetical protein